MSDKVWTEPNDRLTRIANDVISTIEQHPLYREGDQAMVLMDDEAMGGIGLFGFDDLNEAIAALLAHLEQLMGVMGKRMDIVLMPDDAGDLT